MLLPIRSISVIYKNNYISLTYVIYSKYANIFIILRSINQSILTYQKLKKKIISIDLEKM